LRTYQHWMGIHLEEHFLRLEESCQLSEYPVQLDRVGIRKCIKELLQQLIDIPELRIRISIDLENEIGAIYIAGEPLSTPPAESYLTGVDVISRNMHRINPKAKLTSFLASTKEIRKELMPGINEVLMVGEDGQILEGLSSNFFAVVGDALWTADNDVLSGITRLMVLDIASNLSLPVVKQGINISDIGLIEEAFITSASRLVLPVKKIDQKSIGKVVPGFVTGRVMSEFTRSINGSLERI
jgi:branched-chain amino acid aminotransferase